MERHTSYTPEEIEALIAQLTRDRTRTHWQVDISIYGEFFEKARSGDSKSMKLLQFVIEATKAEDTKYKPIEDDLPTIPWATKFP